MSEFKNKKKDRCQKARNFFQWETSTNTLSFGKKSYFVCTSFKKRKKTFDFLKIETYDLLISAVCHGYYWWRYFGFAFVENSWSCKTYIWRPTLLPNHQSNSNHTQRWKNWCNYNRYFFKDGKIGFLLVLRS